MKTKPCSHKMKKDWIADGICEKCGEIFGHPYISLEEKKRQFLKDLEIEAVERTKAAQVIEDLSEWREKYACSDWCIDKAIAYLKEKYIATPEPLTESK